MKQKNILFVCKNNRFRSKVAENYFNKINKNKKIKASSAGVFIGEPINKKTAKIVKKLGIIIKGNPRSMSTDLLKKQDLIVIMANDVPKSLFNNKPVKKLIRFKIKDVYKINEKPVLKAAQKIINKVDELIKDIKSKGLKI